MKFIALDYSPWSEKARWALDYSGAKYIERQYTSMVGEPLLRLVTKQLTGKVTVPILIDGHQKLTDSLDIASYANTVGNQRHDLFCYEEDVREWDALSEKALSIGRYYGVLRQLEDSDAHKEILPPYIPDVLRPRFAWLAVKGLKFHIDKYPVADPDKEQVREILLKLRLALGNKNTILEQFSYCDISMAVALQFVKPVKGKFSAHGPAVAKCWTEPSLSQEFSDLVEWRDWLYANYR